MYCYNSFDGVNTSLYGLWRDESSNSRYLTFFFEKIPRYLTYTLESAFFFRRSQNETVLLNTLFFCVERGSKPNWIHIPTRTMCTKVECKDSLQHVSITMKPREQINYKSIPKTMPTILSGIHLFRFEYGVSQF